MSNADSLASGGRKASYLSDNGQNELATDFALGFTPEQIKKKYGLADQEFHELLTLYVEQKPLPILSPVREGDSAPKTVSPAAEIPPAESPKPEWHYTAQPRRDMCFVIVLSKEHSSRVIVPDAHKEKSDVGFVWGVGPEVQDLKVGDIVLFNKFASIGQEYDLLDENGDDQRFLMLSEMHIAAVLKKSQRKEYRHE